MLLVFPRLPGITFLDEYRTLGVGTTSVYPNGSTATLPIGESCAPLTILRQTITGL